jgi:hypothetical protein
MEILWETDSVMAVVKPAELVSEQVGDGSGLGDLLAERNGGQTGMRRLDHASRKVGTQWEGSGFAEMGPGRRAWAPQRKGELETDSPFLRLIRKVIKRSNKKRWIYVISPKG